MNDNTSGFTSANAGETSTADGARVDSWHDVPGLQSYVREVGKVASALSTDDGLAQRVIDAVHRGSSTALTQVFTDIGVESRVSVSTFDGPLPGEASTGGTTTGGMTALAKAGGPTTRTITISIGIGPISISVTIKKESK
jgi:hypothetical protein